MMDKIGVLSKSRGSRSHTPVAAGNNCIPAPARERGFTLIEVMFAIGVIGVLVVALYGALASSISMVKSCQENERVTQILSDKMDTIRLYNWTQMTNKFVLTNFVVGIDPLNTSSRPYYTGSIAIAYAPITQTYRTNLLEVTVNVDWVSGNRPQRRSMTTYVAKYGLQSYIMR